MCVHYASPSLTFTYTHEHTIHSYIVLFIVHAQTYKQSTHTHRNVHTHTHLQTPFINAHPAQAHIQVGGVGSCRCLWKRGRGQTNRNGSRGKEIMKIKENFKAIADSLLHFQYCTYTFHSFSLIIIVFQFQFHCTIHIQNNVHTHTQEHWNCVSFASASLASHNFFSQSTTASAAACWMHLQKQCSNNRRPRAALIFIFSFFSSFSLQRTEKTAEFSDDFPT